MKKKSKANFISSRNFFTVQSKSLNCEVWRKEVFKHLVEDPSLQRFKSYEKGIRTVKRVGDVLTIVVVAATRIRRHSIEGDLFGLFSAISCGLFTVLPKKCVGSEGEKIDVQKFFGYIGLVTLLGLWWLCGGCLKPSLKRYIPETKVEVMK